MQTNKVLLDTHVWIWLMNGDFSFSKKSRILIEEAHQSGSLFISAISAWEVSMLESKNKIKLNKPCIEWIRTSIHHGIQYFALTPEIAVESCQLPDYDFGDPADRIIIATARVASMTLLTRDKRILAYGQQKRVSVMDV